MAEPLLAAPPLWAAGPASGIAFAAPSYGNGPAALGATPSISAPTVLGPSASTLLGAAHPLAPQPIGPLSYGVPASSLLMTVAIRRGQPQGPASDQEIEDFVYDALELLAGTADVEVRADGGRVTLTGSVQHKRLKRDVGEIVWTIPTVNDVQNNVTIASRRRTRTAGREPEAPNTQGRKQS